LIATKIGILEMVAPSIGAMGFVPPTQVTNYIKKNIMSCAQKPQLNLHVNLELQKRFS